MDSNIVLNLITKIIPFLIKTPMKKNELDNYEKMVSDNETIDVIKLALVITGIALFIILILILKM